MSSSKSPTGSLRKHGRNISQPLLRRSTKGPLDAPDDPLAASPVVSSLDSPPATGTSTSLGESLQATTPLAEPAIAFRPKSNVDLRFLQDQRIYHSLSTEDVAPAFINSKNTPPLETSLPQLLKHGHFRRAADAAVSSLIHCRSDDAEQILQLLYTRLACLVLISRADLALQEGMPLTELLARSPPGTEDIVHLVPWELRLLLVRLQSFGAADGGRRGIMALYALGSEVRAHIMEGPSVSNEGKHGVWLERLHDLGFRVADALVEMGELETANRHLDTLADADSDEVAYRKALLRIRVGDVAAAQRCLGSVVSDDRQPALEALLQMADGDVSGAARKWQGLLEQHPDHPLFANNFAVSLLYTGQISQAREALKQLTTNQSPCKATQLFNLTTVYELCTERAAECKVELTQQLAAKVPGPASGGWEKSNIDFKL